MSADIVPIRSRWVVVTGRRLERKVDGDVRNKGDYEGAEE